MLWTLAFAQHPLMRTQTVGYWILKFSAMRIWKWEAFACVPTFSWQLARIPSVCTDRSLWLFITISSSSCPTQSEAVFKALVLLLKAIVASKWACTKVSLQCGVFLGSYWIFSFVLVFNRGCLRNGKWSTSEAFSGKLQPLVNTESEKWGVGWSLFMSFT